MNGNKVLNVLMATTKKTKRTDELMMLGKNKVAINILKQTIVKAVAVSLM